MIHLRYIRLQQIEWFKKIYRMYIPITFIGSALCSGSGYGYTYYNTIAATDTFNYTSQCGGASQTVNLLQSQSIQFNASSISNITPDTTALVDLIWNITGSDRGDNPQCYLRSYTLARTYTGPVDTSYVDFYYIDNTGFKVATIGQGVSSVTIEAATIPKVYEAGRSSPLTTITGITITDNGPGVGDTRFTSNFRNAPVKKTLLTFASASVGESARIDYLDLDGNYKRINWSQSTGLSQPVYSYYTLSKTVPFVVTSGSLSHSADANLIAFMSGAIFQPASSSCYNYFVQVPYTTTVSYTDCNNVTQSIFVSYPATASINICAKANTVTFPLTGSWTTISAIIEPKNPC